MADPTVEAIRARLAGAPAGDPPLYVHLLRVDGWSQPKATFIANAPTDIAYLLARVDEMDAQVDRYRDVIAALEMPLGDGALPVLTGTRFTLRRDDDPEWTV